MKGVSDGNSINFEIPKNTAHSNFVVPVLRHSKTSSEYVGSEEIPYSGLGFFSEYTAVWCG
jgi:hypothetical protein